LSGKTTALAVGCFEMTPKSFLNFHPLPKVGQGEAQHYKDFGVYSKSIDFSLNDSFIIYHFSFLTESGPR
jgi:hypothetical protein